MSTVEHRDSPRISPKSALSAQVLLESGHLVLGDVLNCSNSGFGLSIPLTNKTRNLVRGRYPQNTPQAKIQIYKDENVILDGMCLIRHGSLSKKKAINSEDDAAILGVSLVRNPSPDINNVHFTTKTPEIDIIDSKERINEVFVDFFGLEQSAASLHIEGSNSIQGTFSCDELSKTVSKICFQTKNNILASEKPGKNLRFSFEMFRSFYIFDSKIVAKSNNRLEVRIPSTVIRVTRRITSRVSPRDNEVFELSIEDGLTESRVYGKILNLTERGFSVLLQNKSPIYAPGFHLKNVRFNLPKAESFTVNAIVVHCSSTDEGLVLLQASLNNNERKNLMPLFNFVVERRYDTTSQLTRIQYEKLWFLFADSGYTDLCEPEAAKFMKSTAESTWSSMEKSPDLLARNVAVDQDGRALAAGLHITRIFSDSWLIHHLAILKGHQRTATPQLFGAMCDYLIQTGAKYVISYTKAGEAWSEKNYYAFAREYPSIDVNFIESYQVLQFPLLTKNQTLSPSTNITIREGTQWDKKRIAKFLSQTESPLWLKAFDLLENTIDLSDISSKYEAAGLQRNRTFFIAETNRKMVAFAMCDIATTGVNIWSLTDNFRVFVVDPLHPKLEEAKRNLTIQALNFYRNAGKPLGLCFSKDTSFKYLKGIEWVEFEKTSLWVTTDQMVPRYRQYNAQVFGRIMAKTRMRKKAAEKRRKIIGSVVESKK